MKTKPDTGAAPIAVVALDCPWCDGSVLLESPLPDEFRCAACSTVIEIAPDPVLVERVLARAA